MKPNIPLLDALTRNWLLILSGTSIRVGLNFLTGVLIVRVLGPTEFGLYAMLTALTGLLSVLLDFGLTEAAVKQMAAHSQASKPPRQQTEQASDDFLAHGLSQQTRLFFWLRLILATGGVILLLLLGLPFADTLFQRAEGDLLLTVTLLGVISTALSGSVYGVLQAIGRFNAISTGVVGSAALVLLFIVGLWLIEQLTLLTSLLTLGVGTSLTGFLIGCRYLPPTTPLWPPPTGATINQHGGQLLRFGGWLWAANLAKMLVSYLDMFLLTLWLSPTAVGVYALALGLVSRVEIINHSLYTVLLPMAAALDTPQAIRQYLRRALWRSGLVSLALLLGLPLAAWLLPLIYGAAYTGAIVPFQYLLGVVIFDILTLPPLLLIYTVDRPDLSALAEWLRVGLFIGLAIWLIPMFGIEGAIAAKFLAKLVGVGVTLVWLQRIM